MHKVNVTFYGILDHDSLGTRDVISCGRDMIRGGVTVLQYRAKTLPSSVFLSNAIALEAEARESGIPFIINDRLDIALLSSADGVHVGGEDVPVRKARELLGLQRIIGVTVRSPDDALRAEREGADYLGAGSVYPSSTKAGVPVIGLEGLRRIVSSVSIPVVAIGGITEERLGEVFSTGVDGVAFISELLHSNEIRKRTKELDAAVSKALKRGGLT